MRIAVEKLKENFSVPVYATPGNHDVYNEQDEVGFSSVFCDINNCFGYGDTLFIMLDTSRICLDKEQLQYLKFVLDNERSKYRRCVIFTHVPPTVIPEFDKPKYRLKKENAAELRQIVDAGKVDLIVCGHAHCEMDIQWGNTRVLVIPPSGQSSRNRNNPRFGSLQLHFGEDGSIVPEFVYCEGNVSEDALQYFIYRRLNQRSIFFCIAWAAVFCSMVLATTRPQKEKSE